MPSALLIAGRSDGLRAYVEQALAEMAGREDPAAVRDRRFLQAVTDRLDAGPH